ncbi:glutathione S-transferase [Sphingorhabdus sp. EL138]|uniref:glutathione S-transferase n=1 Tax=Sphingorhabdus sp. EL138 TaxID=2073156 RepID=UPI0025DFF166|nr:glutathione S-transferase [Sphingorhabdus sp. EL138]
MTALPILYSFRRCPYAMRARMAVAVSAVQVELREIVLRDKPSEMLEASPKGTVPVLVLPDGRVLDESLDIMRWALVQSDSLGWLAHDDPNLVLATDGPFKIALDRYKYPHRYDLNDGTAHRDAALAHLGDLNDLLSAALYLGGAQPAFTDIAIFPFVRQFAATDAIWFAALPLPALQSWLSALVSSDLFASIMARYPQWKVGDAPVRFP